MQKWMNTQATCKYMTNDNQGVHPCKHERKLQSDLKNRYEKEPINSMILFHNLTTVVGM